jgi:hypothetical protein
MTIPHRADSAALRGSLQHAPAGAAALYKAAELACCPAHALMTLVGVSPGAVATDVLGLPDADARSPFAITRGVTYERSLRSRGADGTDAARLRAVLSRHAPLAALGSLLDVASVVPAGPAAALGRDSVTAGAIAALAAGSSKAPAIVWQPSLPVRLAGTEFRVRPDLLLAGPDGRYTVGEIKSWPEDGPRTDPGAVRSALGQAAVGALALGQAAGPAAAGEPAASALLIAPAARRATPVLRVHSVDRELHVLTAADDALLRSAAAAAERLGADARLDDPRTVASLPTRYGDLCASRCALARWCRERAADSGDPAALGAQAAALPPGRLRAAADAAAGAGRPGPGFAGVAAAGLAYRQALPGSGGGRG